MSEPTPPALFQNSLYLHPSDGPSSLTVQEKLIGAQNYKAWKRAIETGLSTKRKLGFVKSTVVRSVNESIGRSIMFIGIATEIWQQLEKRFSVSDGSRKYMLNKNTNEITQSGSSIGDYFTKIKCVWEELDSLNTLPAPAITAFLTALSKQKEEQRLFQFLNGLEDCYSHQKSQILMMNPFLNVESACSFIQQEESQRMLFGSSSNVETTTLYSKGNVKDKCGICGFKWHPPEKCWKKVGYLPWHSKFKGSQVKQTKNGQGFNNGAEDEINHYFAAGISCLNSQIDLLKLLEDGIYDIGASDHMTPVHSSVFYPYLLKIKPQIKLPNGDTLVISHVGKVKLDNGILLKDVLVVPSFKFSLLSVPKLTEDSQYLVQTALQKFAFRVVNKKDYGSYALWHHRLDHVSNSKLKHMNEFLVSLSKSCLDKYLSCPMAKFTKLPYDLSDSHSTNVFELMYIDIWGPYKVPTDGKFRNALSSAANEAMSMILSLQQEKAQIEMVARQFKRFAAEKTNHDQQEIIALEELLCKREQTIQSLTCEVQAYKYRMMSYGLTESEEGEKERSPRQQPVIEKVVVGHTPRTQQPTSRFSLDSGSSIFASIKEYNSSVKKVDSASENGREMSDRICMVDSINYGASNQNDPKANVNTNDIFMNSPKDSMHHSHNDVQDPEVLKLYARLHALEADRESIRQVIIKYANG
nr:cysteine-rich RLK (receptor-like protein kinase) 8 [Tanacetum cinerariifolium]